MLAAITIAMTSIILSPTPIRLRRRRGSVAVTLV